MSEHAIAEAQGWLETIRDLVNVLNETRDEVHGEAHERAIELIQQQPLSVMVRDGWRSPGGFVDSDNGAEEYEILLSTGGPALRIYGQLDQYNQPDEFPRLQWQDWGTPWTDYPLGEEREAVQTFAQQFYFGE